MRYPEGGSPDAEAPYTALMHDMLTFSMLLGVVIGVVLLALGRHGRSLWLTVWSAGLILLSALYLGADAIGVF